MTKDEVKQYVYNFLIKKGLPKKSACAIMGNIDGENGQWKCTEEEASGGGGFGLCQWTDTKWDNRRTQLEKYGTDLSHQCKFMWSELTGENTSVTGAKKQWIENPSDSVNPNRSYSFPLSDFLDGDGSVSELTAAWCYCWERPAYASNHLSSIRIPGANKYYSSMKYNGSGGEDNDSEKTGTEMVEDAVTWALKIAADSNHGYDQTNRWGPDYDCSSFVISAYQQAGIPVKSNGASWTGNIREKFKATGFEEVSLSKLRRGDVIVKSGYHVVMYIGNNQIVHASINENGGITGGQTGDQTGKEICVRSYYIHSGGWDCALRYPADGGTDETPTADEDYSGDVPAIETSGSLYGAIRKTPFKYKGLTNKTYLQSIRVGSYTYVKPTFRKNKKISGRTQYGNRLTFDNKRYKIIKVDKNGFISVRYHGGNVKHVNPQLLKGEL